MTSADRSQTIKDAITLAYLRTNVMHYLCFAAVGFAAFVFLLLFSVNTQLRKYLWLGANLAAVSVLRLVEISPVLSTGVPLWLTTALFEKCNALPLGIVRGTTYESSQFYLGHGSRLTFYSDGVVEAQNQKGELFGFQRGLEISTQSAAAIVEAARRFRPVRRHHRGHDRASGKWRRAHSEPNRTDARSRLNPERDSD